MAKTGMQMITNTLARLYKLPAADAMAFVDTFFAIISSELKNGRQVKVKGLGTFKVQSVKPRESVNVNTGERVLIEGHDKVTFTPDTAMKELVNKPFSQFELSSMMESLQRTWSEFPQMKKWIVLPMKVRPEILA